MSTCSRVIAAAALTGLVLCAPARAATPASQSVGNAILPDAGGSSLGTFTFSASFGDTSALGSSRAPSVRLVSGRTYRFRSCVWAKAAGEAPLTQCVTRQLTADLLAGVTGVAAPAADLSMARPQAGRPAATMAGLLVIDEQQGGAWAPYASSWPEGGLPGAGIAIPAVDQQTGSVLAPQGPLLPGVRQGGIDTGAQDSICQGRELPATLPARGSASALGSLATAYEVSEPAGRPRGIMVLLHGGGWQLYGAGARETMRGDADRWLARGWRTVNGGYRPCEASLDDSLALLDRVRRTYGSKLPICIEGQSSGGHLALVLASLRPQVSCVISEAGVGDLTALAHQTAPDGSDRNQIELANATVAAFGADRLAKLSPTRTGVAAPVLFAVGTSDPLIPWAQATAFRSTQLRADPTARVDIEHLQEGSEPWVHALISSAALARFHARERALVGPLLRGGLSAPADVTRGALRKGGLPLVATCPRACRVKVRLTVARRSARSLHLPVAIGSARGSRSTVGGRRLAVRIGAHARRRITAGTPLHVAVSMTGKQLKRHFAATVRVR